MVLGGCFTFLTPILGFFLNYLWTQAGEATELIMKTMKECSSCACELTDLEVPIIISDVSAGHSVDAYLSSVHIHSLLIRTSRMRLTFPKIDDSDPEYASGVVVEISDQWALAEELFSCMVTSNVMTNLAIDERQAQQLPF